MRKGGLPTELRVAGRFFVALLACSVGLNAQSPNGGSERELVRVHGIVVNAVTHAAIPRALVTSLDQHMAVMTDDKGRFEFDVNVVTGGAMGGDLRGAYQNQAPYINVKKPGYLPSTQATVLPLGDLAALKTELRLQLTPEGSISGTAIGATDEVPVGLNIQLLRRQVQDGLAIWIQMQSQPVDARGRFHFGALSPGDYKIVTEEWADRQGPLAMPGSKPVTGYPPQFYPSGSSLASAAILRVSGGQNVVADLNLRGTLYFPVQIPIVSSSAVKFVQVQVASENGPGYNLGFNPKSQRIEGLLPDGTYRVAVVEMGEAAPGANPEIRDGTGNLTVAGKGVRGGEITLLPAATIAVNVRGDFTGPDPAVVPSGAVVFTSGPIPDPAVSGQVLGNGAGAGNPAPRPRLVEAALNPAQAGFEGNSIGSMGFNGVLQADPNTGDLEFKGVVPGRYRIQISPQRGYVASVTANGVDLLREPLVVQSGAEPSPISIILRDDSGTLSGTVSGTAARQKMNFSNFVIAYPLGDGQAAQPVFASWQADGTFTMPNVVPGSYFVVAVEGRPPDIEFRNRDAMKAHESQGVVVEVTAGQTVTTTLKRTLKNDGSEYGIDD